MKNYQLVGPRPLDPENDVGKDMAVAFNLGTIKSEKYGEALIEGHFLCALPYGHFPKISKERFEEAEKDAIDWALKTGLISEDDQYYEKFLKIGIGKVAVLTAANDVKLYTHFLIYFFCLDDLISDFKFFKQNISPPTYQEIKEALEIFISVIRGNYTDLNQIPKSSFPLFMPFCTALFMIREEALSSKKDIVHLIEEIVKNLRSVLWERECVEHNKMKTYSTDEYKFSRNWTIAVRPSVEASILPNDIVVSEEVRKHPLFEQYFQQACIQIALVNDTLSLKKEIMSDEFQTDNFVLVKNKKYSLQKSIQKTVKKANDLVIALKKTELGLKNCFPHDSNLDKFILGMQYFVDGNIYWHQQSQRYGDFEYDYYTVQYTKPKLSTSDIFFEQPISPNQLQDTQESVYFLQPAIEKSFFRKGKGSPIENGLRFLESSCSVVSGFQSRIGHERTLSKSSLCPYAEVFSSALILDLLHGVSANPKLFSTLNNFLTDQSNEGKFNFFTQRSFLPDDVDSTAFCTLALLRHANINMEKFRAVSKKILDNVNEEGIIQVYFPPQGERKNRIDATICASAMRLIYQAGLDADAKKTEDYMYQTLESKTYLAGTWFYPPPDVFLYYLSKAIILAPRALDRFYPLLVENLQERLGTTSHPLDLAMRILTVTTLELVANNAILEKVSEEKLMLESLQKQDGSWPKDALYKAGRSDTYFGGKEISTAFSVSALRALQTLELKKSNAMLETKEEMNEHSKPAASGGHRAWISG